MITIKQFIIFTYLCERILWIGIPKDIKSIIQAVYLTIWTPFILIKAVI